MTIQKAIDYIKDLHIRMNGQGYSDLISFDFKKRTIKNGSVVLYNGKPVKNKIRLYDYEMKIDEWEGELEEGSWEELERLYEKYRYSVPEPYEKFSKSHFVAVGLNDLTMEQFEKGGNRQTARIELESYLFFHKFKWENEKHHYWQSKKMPQLIVYKNWVQGVKNA